jgi:hypothetical protein
MPVITKDSPHICINTVHWLHEEFPDGVDEGELIQDTVVHAYGEESHAGFEPEVYLDGLLRYVGKILKAGGGADACLRALKALPDEVVPNMVVAEAKGEGRIQVVRRFLGTPTGEDGLVRMTVVCARAHIEELPVDDRPEAWASFVAAARNQKLRDE